jgi:hypothetical protein
VGKLASSRVEGEVRGVSSNKLINSISTNTGSVLSVGKWVSAEGSLELVTNSRVHGGDASCVYLARSDSDSDVVIGRDSGAAASHPHSDLLSDGPVTVVD